MKTPPFEKEGHNQQILVAGRGGHQGNGYGDKKHQDSENSTASKAVGKHAYWYARQRAQLDWDCTRKAVWVAER